MSVTFILHPDKGLAHIRFRGHITLAETLARSQEFAATPGVTPDIHQIIDFREVTSFERDYAKLMAMMARMPEHMIHPGHEPLMIYVAPTALGQEMANFVIRSMQGLPGPLLRITSNMPEALALLGLPERISDLG